MRTNKNARAVIVKDGKIAMIHRKKEGKEYWVTPGGGVEEGENIVEAVVREVWEETGRKVKKFKRIHEKDEDGNMHYYFRCEIDGDELEIIGPEKDGMEDNWYRAEWISIEDLKKVTYYPENLLELIEKKD